MHSILGRSVCFIAAFATVAGGAPLQAQGMLPLDPGTRVRVFGPSVVSGGLVGVVVGLVPDTLAIRPAERSDTVVVALSALTRLELSTGQHSHTLKGAGVGLLLGGVGGWIAGSASGDDRGSWYGYTAREKAHMGAVLFGAAGALVGAAIGGRPTEGWAPVRLPSGSRITAAPRSDGRLSLVYSVAF